MANLSVQAIIRLTTLAETGGIDLLNQKLHALNGTLNQVNGQSQKAGESIRNFSNQSMTSLRQVGQGIMSIGAMWSIGITYPLVQAGKDATEAYAKFDQGRAALRAVTSDAEAMAAGFKDADDAANKTGQSVLGWSKKFTFGAVEALKTTLFTKEAGIDNIRLAEAFAKKGAALATAVYDMNERTAQNYTDSTLKMVGVTRLFHGTVLEGMLAQKDYAGAEKLVSDNANFLAIVANQSSARYNQLIETITRAAPVVSLLTDKFKLTREEVEKMGWGLQGAAIDAGILADKGITTARGGTEIGSAWLHAITKGKGAMEQWGISITDVNGKIKSQDQLIGELNQLLFGNAAALKKSMSGVGQLSAKELEANKKFLAQAATDTKAFADRQEKSIQRIRDAMATEIKKKKPDRAEIEAEKQAMAAISGTSEQVIAQTRALINNKPVWDALPPSIHQLIFSMNDYAENTGKKVATSHGKVKKAAEGLTDANKKLLDAQGRLTEEGRLTLAKEIFGQVGMKAAIPLVEAGTKARDKYKKQVKEGGTAEEIAAKKTRNFADALALLNVKWQNLMIETVGPFIDKYIAPLIEKISDLIDWFSSLDDATKETAIWIAGIAAAIGPVLFVLGGLMFSIGMIGSGLAGLASMGGIAAIAFNPLLLAILALGAIFGAVALTLISNTDEIKDRMYWVWEGIGERIKKVTDFLKVEIPRAIGIAKSFIEGFGLGFLENIDFKGLFDSVDKLGAALKDLWHVFVPPAMKMEDVISGKISYEEFKASQREAQMSAQNIGRMIGGFLAEIVNKFKPIIDGITSITRTLTEELPKWVEAVKKHIPNIQAPLINLGTALDKLVNALLGLIQIDPKDIENLFKIIGAGVDVLAIAVDKLADGISRLADFLKTFDFGSLRMLTIPGTTITMPGIGPTLNEQKQSLQGFLQTLGDISDSAEWRSFVDGMLKKMPSAANEGTKKTEDYFKRLSDNLVGHSIIPDMVKGILDWLRQLQQGWQSGWQNILLVAVTITAHILSAIFAFGNMLVSYWNGFWRSLPMVVFNAMSAVGNIISGWRGYIQATWVILISGLQNAWSNFWGSLRNAVISGINAAIAALTSGLSQLTNIFNGFNLGGTTPPATTPGGGGGGGGHLMAGGGFGIARQGQTFRADAGEGFWFSGAKWQMPFPSAPAMAGAGMNQTINVSIGSVKDSNDAYLLAREVARIIRENS